MNIRSVLKLIIKHKLVLRHQMDMSPQVVRPNHRTQNNLLRPGATASLEPETQSVIIRPLNQGTTLPCGCDAVSISND